MVVEVIRNKWQIVHASGEIDLANIHEFRSAVEVAAGESPHGFVIDLSDATYIDSAGIQTILTAYRRVHTANGRLAVVVHDVNVKAILRIIHLDTLPGMYMCEDLAASERALSTS
jgi:anti-anti-sigma factor